MSKVYLAAFVTVAGLASVPAAAITAFASFSPLSNAPNLEFIADSNGAGTLSSIPGSPVTFRFLDPTGSTSVFDVTANFNFLANTANGVAAGGLGIAPVTAGSFTFTSLGAVTFNGNTGTNLLTAAFTGGALSGLAGGSAASFVNSQPPGDVVFTSDFFDFSNSTARDIAIAINAINPVLAASPGGLAGFAGTASGNFGAEFSDGSGLEVPEPATWAMMVMGFGLVGAIRRRQTSIRFAKA